MLSVALIAVVLSPIVQNWREPQEDGFPLSYYPMFTTVRDGAGYLSYLMGTDSDGYRYRIPFYFAGMGGFNQARRQVNKWVRDGESNQLCSSVANVVSRQSDAPYTDMNMVYVVTGGYRFDDFFSGNEVPFAEVARASCAVERV